MHQNGYDPMHEVQKKIESASGKWSPLTPPGLQAGVVPVRYINGDWLDADFDLGKWASAHIQSHIHGMDQNLTFRFPVPRERWRPRPISRTYSGQIAPATTEPIPSKETAKPPSAKVTSTNFASTSSTNEHPSFKSFNASPSEKEIHCSKSMYAITEALRLFVNKYTEEAGVKITSMHCGMAGNISGHTIKGHDRFSEYDLVPKGEEGVRSPERVYVRLRERDLENYITVWSAHGQMRDFITSVFNEEVKEYLRDLIDKAITTSNQPRGSVVVPELCDLEH